VNNSIDKIATDFIKQCLDVSITVNTSTINSLSWKNIHYIWKQYLSLVNIPNMLYTNSLKELLKGKLIHNETTNNDLIFLNVTSKYLPSVSSFLTFWEKHITILVTNVSFDDEYEIEEILTLYKSSDFKNVPISDKDIIKMINHYYSPQVEVIDNKYITNIRCNLWIKHENIRTHLDTFKATQKIVTTNVINHSNKELISFDEFYKSYKSYCIAKQVVDKQVSPIVSKQFFEKFLIHELQQYIQFDKFVSSQWLNDE
jgi:hypothetical protein